MGTTLSCEHSPTETLDVAGLGAGLPECACISPYKRRPRLLTIILFSSAAEGIPQSFETKKKKRAMESTLDHRTYPKCPNLIAGADPHPFCFLCMGPDHAVSGMGPAPACSACQMIPRLTREHRGQHFLARGAPHEESKDQDLDVVEIGEPGDEEAPFQFCLPWGQMTPIPDKDASLSGGPTLKSARIDFPALMTLVAERVGLPLPPPLPPRPVSRLRQGFYGPVHPAQPTFVSPQLPEIWQCVEATWWQPFKTKAPVAAMAGIIRVEGRWDTTCPGVPPLDESLAAHLLPTGWLICIHV